MKRLLKIKSLFLLISLLNFSSAEAGKDQKSKQTHEQAKDMQERLQKLAHLKKIGQTANHHDVYISSVTPLDEEWLRENPSSGYSWNKTSPLEITDFCLLGITYYGFDNKLHTDGKLIVHQKVAPEVVQIFSHLAEIKFPIERMELIDAYKGCDDDSMTANNTSALCTRYVSGSDTWSNHAYGLAIDINPVQNPCIGKDWIAPAQGKRYVDRTLLDPAMITPESEIYKIFKEYGWEWGGECFGPDYLDYHHFQKPIPEIINAPKIQSNEKMEEIS